VKPEAAERGQPSQPTVLRFFGEIIDPAIPPLDSPRHDMHASRCNGRPTRAALAGGTQARSNRGSPMDGSGWFSGPRRRRGVSA
jgi:hypothetical protein